MRRLDHIASIEDASERISSIAQKHDLSSPVPHLPRWQIRDVLAHLGGVQRWATRIVQDQSMAGPGARKSKLAGQELCDWFDEGAAALITELRNHDLAGPCPNFNPGSERTVGWWARRQAHEATVHRWDVEHAVNMTTAIPAALAVDGVDEFLDVFVRTRGKQTLAATLELSTTRPRRTWTLTPAEKPGRIDVASGRADAQGSRVTSVSGKPESLLLGLWGRLSATDATLTIDGPTSTAASLIALD